MSSAEHPNGKEDSRSLDFLRSARDLRGLTETQIDRIERRLRPPRTRRIRFMRPAFAASMAIFLLAGVALASGIVRIPALSRWFASAPARPNQAPASPAHAHGQRSLAAIEPATPPSGVTVSNPESAPLVVPAPEPVRRSRPRIETPSSNPVARPPAEMPAPPAPSVFPAATTKQALPESPLLAEGRSFSEALSKWHRDRNAQAALATLDTHDRRFGDGQMRLEARLLRAEIVLSLGRDREAMAILDAVSLAGLPRERELRTVRGELRIKHGRCAEGRADLAAVTAIDGLDGLGQRATRAAALCR